jgi:prepilin-type processing-associated H-X9-DG protein
LEAFLLRILSDFFVLRRYSRKSHDGKNYYDLLTPVLENPHVWDCPAANVIPAGVVGYMSYHMNGRVITTNGLKTSAVAQPSFTLLMNDAGEKRRWDRAFLRPEQDGGSSYALPISNHKGGGNVVFVDGSALPVGG